MSFGAAPRRPRLDQPANLINEDWIEETKMLKIDELRMEIGQRISGEGLRTVFSDMDADGSGMISAAELGQALNNMSVNVTKPDLEYCMSVMDRDGNGGISMDEFVDFFQKDFGKAFFKARDDRIAT